MLLGAMLGGMGMGMGGADMFDDEAADELNKDSERETTSKKFEPKSEAKPDPRAHLSESQRQVNHIHSLVLVLTINKR